MAAPSGRRDPLKAATRIVVVGVGPLGRLVLEACRGRSDVVAVGAVDVDPQIVGKDVAGVKVSASIEALGPADVALHTATSRRTQAVATIRTLLDRGWSVASSCEELFEPDPELEAYAASKNLRVVATGVNPGLVMDRLPILLASACVSVDEVRVRRIVDLSERRDALRKKMGVGLTEDEARARKDLGHVGLRESMSALLAAIGRTAERVEHTLDPIVREGCSVGMDERLVAHAGGRPLVTLALRMQMGAASSDEIEIDGDPPIRCRFEGGIQGDRATVGLLLSAAKAIA